MSNIKNDTCVFPDRRWVKLSAGLAVIGFSVSATTFAMASPSATPSTEQSAGAEQALEDNVESDAAETEENFVPVVVDDQLQKILTSIAAATKAGDSAKDEAKIKNRLSDESLRMRTINYRNRKLDDGTKPIPAVSADNMRAAWMPEDPEFPRQIAVVTQQSDDKAPILMNLQQETARENYTLTHGLPLLEEAELPATMLDEAGTEKLAFNDGTDLAMSPEKAVESVMVTLDDSGSDEAKKLADSSTIKKIHKDQKALQDALEETDVSFKRRLFEDSPVALRLPDGSAIAFAAISSSETMTPKEDTTLKLSDLPAAVAEEADLNLTGKEPVTLKYREHIAVHIPKDGKVTLIGYFAQLHEVN